LWAIESLHQFIEVADAKEQLSDNGRRQRWDRAGSKFMKKREGPGIAADQRLQLNSRTIGIASTAKPPDALRLNDLGTAGKS
jgi:DnaJ-class molecular chaperone